MLLRFFNQKSSVNAGLQVINVMALSYETYKLLNSPDATVAMFGLKVLTHVSGYMALGESSLNFTQVGAEWINSAHIGAVYLGSVMPQCTNMGSIEALVNVAVSLGNMVVPYHSDESSTPKP